VGSDLINYDAVGILAIVIRHANRIIPAPHNIVICGLTGCVLFLYISQMV